MNFLCGNGYGITKPVPAPPRPVAIPIDNFKLPTANVEGGVSLNGLNERSALEGKSKL